MEDLVSAVISLYLLSTACYLAYLFFQKDALHHFGYYILFAGLLCHSAIIIAVFVQTGAMPVRNLFETLSLAAWAVAVVFLAVRHRFKLKILGIFAAPAALSLMVVASQLPRHTGPVKDIFSSFWFVLHVVSVFVGDAAFALACGAGILYLVQERAIKNKSRGFFFRRLPSLERLDAAGYTCIVVGFTFLTAGLIAGFIYAKSVWGRFWSWDPKEVWSAVTWLVYAALLHERLTVGWRGRRAAIFSIIAFAVLLFTFFGVNFLLKGHHGEFTRF
ncbi:MAG: c-type cytochrome biogenesis protein CcsB [Deltaproteobacteria bacterium]|nr:c-type cytochrome biogenesis protein CcsB [Deltaproteobacteria bacterium]MBW2040747.1 c-type cytochrome biogenesis protein CcsB [Deltaproteobacteria bacterium]MBW2131151.1 c-type cytochrome biogenesis protein CcsB [Deltaproteobacteria bacterium]